MAVIAPLDPQNQLSNTFSGRGLEDPLDIHIHDMVHGLRVLTDQRNVEALDVTGTAALGVPLQKALPSSKNSVGSI